MTERGQGPNRSERLTGCERSRVSEPGLQLGREAPRILREDAIVFEKKLGVRHDQL